MKALWCGFNDNKNQKYFLYNVLTFKSKSKKVRISGKKSLFIIAFEKVKKSAIYLHKVGRKILLKKTSM